MTFWSIEAVHRTDAVNPFTALQPALKRPATAISSRGSGGRVRGALDISDGKGSRVVDQETFEPASAS
jgi:hypothetical protein